MTDYSIFFIIAVAATGVGALLFLLSLFGLGEHDLDFDADAGGADVGLLSIKSGIGFFLGRGGVGIGLGDFILRGDDLVVGQIIQFYDLVGQFGARTG